MRPSYLALLLSACLTPVPAISQSHMQMTPLLMKVHDAPVPFRGSDGRTHLVYELWVTNFSSGEVAVQEVEVMSGGKTLLTMDSAAIASRLQPAGLRKSRRTLPPSTSALLFIHVVLPKGVEAPSELVHHVRANFSAAPPGQGEVDETGGRTPVDHADIVEIEPPLRGENFLAADSCCDAVRHTRAVLPIDERAWLAQRYAVDWEQLSADHRISHGPISDPKSYNVFGNEVHAVADGTVVLAINDQPEQVPQHFPTNITIDQADGNAVILDIGHGRFALFAHMQTGSVRVKAGDHVKTGQVIGLVGNSGNSLEPHLHFQVMDRGESLAANGLPYTIRSYEMIGHSPGTAAFDKAAAEGTPLAITPENVAVHDALPLDQTVVNFTSSAAR